MLNEISISVTSASLTEEKIKHGNTEITKAVFAEFAIRYFYLSIYLKSLD